MRRLIVIVFAVLGTGAADAHEAAATGAGPAFQALLVFMLTSGAALYASGIVRLWRRAGAGRGIRRVEVTAFALGWSSLTLALLSPIDAAAQHSFAVHMVQHELLMVVAAPLIVLGRPLQAVAWGISPGMRVGVAAFAHAPIVQRAWRPLTGTLGAWTVHAVALWTWHLPLLFGMALASLAWHVTQHACFFFSALGFWWSAFGTATRNPSAGSIASVFTTMLHTSALGALLTFAPSAWYPIQAPSLFGLSNLEDQQLGGLVMWVPGGFAYMVAGLAIVRRWLASPLSPSLHRNVGAMIP